MAKVIGPLMSMDARGKIGDAMVFMGWKGLKTVRQWLKPANPDTPNQQAIRTKFSTAVAKHHLIAGSDKIAWNAWVVGQAISGFNFFVKRVIDTLLDSKTWVLIKNITVTPLTTTSGTITGAVDNVALLKAEYGTSSKVYPYTQNETDPRAVPGVIDIDLTGLIADTTYFYRVVVKTPGATVGETGEYSFTTPAI